MACDVDTTLENACESGIGKVDDEVMLLRIIAQLSCEIQDALAGGGGGVVSGNVLGSGSPQGVVTPAAAGQFYSDTTGFGLWQAFGATNTSWHQWI